MIDLTHEPVVFSRWSGPRHVMSPPPAELVVELQTRTAFPAVTLLLPTTAASVMTPQDRVVLRGLLDQAGSACTPAGSRGPRVSWLSWPGWLRR